MAMAIGNKLTEYSVKQELRNLSMEDAHRRHIAMNVLTKHVQQLDGNEVPNFLKQVSQSLHKSKPTSISYINGISLSEQAVRRHGASLVCQLGIIICMLRTALNLVGFNSVLQQACVKLVRSIANYVICASECREQVLIEEIKEPVRYNQNSARLCGDTGPQVNNRHNPHVYGQQILKDLCNPLLEKVGEAPRCLHALVETPSWKYASQDLVNQTCLQATRGFLIKGSQSVGHMQLICSLAKKNGLNLKPHVGTLLKAAAEILDKGTIHNWQQRLCSVQMMNCFVKISNSFELQEIMGILERQGEDKMPCVRKVVAETIHRAKLLFESLCFQIEERICTNVVFSSEEEESTSSNGEQVTEGYGDSDLNPNSGVNSEWSVRNNPIASDEIQGHIIIPAYTNGKDIIVDLKREIMVEGLGLFWGAENYQSRSHAYKQENCCGESSEFERSGETSSVSSVNMESIEKEQCYTDLEDTERPEKLSSDDQAEAELEEVVSAGNCKKMIKEYKSSYTDLEDIERHEKLSSNGQAEDELEVVPDLKDTERREKLSSNSQAEAEFEKVVLAGNCEKMIMEDKSSYTDLEDIERHEKLSSNGQAEAELEEVVPDLENTERHEKFSSNGQAESELEEVVPDLEDTERHEKLSTKSQAEAELEEFVPAGNCGKMIKEDKNSYTDLEDIERHEKLSSNGQDEDELEKVVPDLEDKERHEKLSSNSQAEAELGEVVPAGNCGQMIREDKSSYIDLEEIERHEKLSSNGQAEAELEKVVPDLEDRERHAELSSNSEAEAELEEVVPVGNYEKVIEEDKSSYTDLEDTVRNEKLSSNSQAEAELEEVVPVGNCEIMIEEDKSSYTDFEDTERHEKVSSNGQVEAELEGVPAGNFEKMIEEDGSPYTDLEDMERHENLSSNGRAEAELGVVPTVNCEKMIKEARSSYTDLKDKERHEKLSTNGQAEAELEVVSTGNCEKMIKEDKSSYTDLEDKKRHEKLSSNGQAEAELEEVVSTGNCEKMIKKDRSSFTDLEDMERHENMSTNGQAEAELKEVIPTGDFGKMIKEDKSSYTDLEDTERHDKLSSNGQAETETELEEVAQNGKCEKMTKEDKSSYTDLEDSERHEKLPSNGHPEAELEGVPTGNCEKIIKEDKSAYGQVEDELEKVVPDLEDRERHEKLSSNSQAEAELEEVVPTGNCEKMTKEDKSSAYWWWMKMGQNSLSSVCSSWSKKRERVELILGISLCAGLMVPAVMFSIKCFLIHEDYHVLVPT